MEAFLHFLNPTNHVTQAGYQQWWVHLLQTTLLGFWGKFFTGLCIFISIWFGVRRQQLQVALGFLMFAALIMYGGGLWSFVSGR
jgi:hypothetical protein